MSDAINIGIIGAGGMLPYHLRGFRQAGANVLAVVDLDPETAAKTVAKWSIGRSFESVSSMLDACPELDAVSIIVPNKFHKELSIQCLKAGKHVFCEKPPALNASELEEMIAAAKSSGRRLQFNFNNRARPESFAMMDYIRSGAVGRINSAQAKWIRRTGIPGLGGWFTSKELSGGGPLIDLLHMVDLALYFMDYPEPEFVLAQTFNDFIQDKSFKGPWGIADVEGGVTDVENAAHGFVKFRSGQVLSLQISWAEMIRREEVSVTFQGQKAGGMLQRLFGIDGVDETSVDKAEIYQQEHGVSVNKELVIQHDPEMGRERSAANFIFAIAGSEAPLNTPDQALALMKIIDATYESARTGKPIAI